MTVLYNGNVRECSPNYFFLRLRKTAENVQTPVRGLKHPGHITISRRGGKSLADAGSPGAA